MAEGGSGHASGAVIAALLANLGIAVAKFVGFLLTGASSMLAEAFHSVADSGNQAMLIVGGRVAERAPDRQHPFGHGRVRYFAAFLVAVILFTLGSLFSLYEGYDKLRHPHELESPGVALAILLLTIFCCIRLRDSRLGRAWIAIREDETAAGAMGIPLMRTKTWAYAIGAFFGGVAGAYVASFNSGAFPSQFHFNISIFLLCMVILGGMGSLWGVVVGGAILAWLNVEGLANIGAWLNEHTPLDVEVAKYQFGIYGTIIVLMM